MSASRSRLEQNRAFEIRHILDSMMLNLIPVISSEKIEAKAVLILLHLVQKASPQYRPLCRIDYALEH